jgi:gliding motility-associated-like protein
LNTAAFPTTCNNGDDGQANVIPAGGVPPYTYSWSNASTTPAIGSLTAGNYTITVIDSHGCIDKAVATVTQPPPIVVSFSADTVKGCSPLCTNFSDVSNDPNYALDRWHWDFGDGDTDDVSSPRHCFNSPGLYGVTLTVKDNKGCTNKLTIPNMIEVYTSPVPSFVMSPQPTTILNPNIQFSDRSTDQYGPISAWQWNFNDPLSGGVNDLSNLQNPMHQYGDTGIYCVNLTVTNIHGCKDSVTQCVVISNNYSLYIPDAFTPNGDGLNDVFLPKGEAVQQYSMYIFDRWGTMIYYTNDINKGWDGTVNGGSKICPTDTYVYEINVTDGFNNTHSYIGKVTLIK